MLVAKVAFLRPQHWHYYDRTLFFLPTLEKIRARSTYKSILENLSLAGTSRNSIDTPVYLT